MVRRQDIILIEMHTIRLGSGSVSVSLLLLLIIRIGRLRHGVVRRLGVGGERSRGVVTQRMRG